MDAIDLSNKKLFLMDMDGTIYLDDKLLPVIPADRQCIVDLRELPQYVLGRHLEMDVHDRTDDL